MLFWATQTCAGQDAGIVDAALRPNRPGAWVQLKLQLLSELLASGGIPEAQQKAVTKLPMLRRTLKGLTLRSDQTDLVFGCSHISQPVLQHLACCPQLRQLTLTSAELMAVDLSALSYLTALEVGRPCLPSSMLRAPVCSV